MTFPFANAFLEEKWKSYGENLDQNYDLRITQFRETRA